MSHTNPYRPPEVADSQSQLAAQVFAKRAAASSSSASPSGSTYTEAATAPGSPVSGDRWFDLTLGILFTYTNDGNSSQWVEL
jgi:hypothetical protein